MKSSDIESEVEIAENERKVKFVGQVYDDLVMMSC